jgi:hypothetical protein
LCSVHREHAVYALITNWTSGNSAIWRCVLAKTWKLPVSSSFLSTHVFYNVVIYNVNNLSTRFQVFIPNFHDLCDICRNESALDTIYNIALFSSVNIVIKFMFLKLSINIYLCCPSKIMVLPVTATIKNLKMIAIT